MSLVEISPADRALALHPWHAAYWTLVAPTLYAAITIFTARALSPTVNAVFTGEVANAERLIWMVLSLPHIAVLIRISLWSQKERAGPFAGNMHLDPKWLGHALIGAPALLLGLNILFTSLFSGGDPDWALQDKATADFLGGSGFGLSMLLFTIVLAPLVEEIGFRGIALGCLLGRGLDPRVAILITAAGFTLIHVQYVPLAMIPVFLMGLFLGWLRVKSRTMAVPIIAHMAANAAPMALLGLS